MSSVIIWGWAPCGTPLGAKVVKKVKKRLFWSHPERVGNVPTWARWDAWGRKDTKNAFFGRNAPNRGACADFVCRVRPKSPDYLRAKSGQNGAFLALLIPGKFSVFDAKSRSNRACDHSCCVGCVQKMIFCCSSSDLFNDTLVSTFPSGTPPEWQFSENGTLRNI